jgi:glyoxylase-like metal-dependent hydrolase (beta-lactamase superfamily II)
MQARRLLARCALVALALLGGSSLGAQILRTADATRRGFRESDFPRLVKLADDVYAYEDLNGSLTSNLAFTTNSLIVVTTDGVVVADGQGSVAKTRRLVERIRTLTPQPIKYVINTHQHGDHTGSNVQFIKTAEIIAQRNARANMVRSKQADTPARVTFGDETAVYLGGTEVQAHYYGRGHTNGDAVVYFPDLRVVHMGDLFTAAFPYIDYENGGSLVEWIKTIDAALKLDFDVAIPGHGPVMNKADLEAYRNKIEIVRQRVRELVRKGVSKDQFLAQLKLDDLGWSVTPNSLAGRSMPRLYDELAS